MTNLFAGEFFNPIKSRIELAVPCSPGVPDGWPLKLEPFVAGEGTLCSKQLFALGAVGRSNEPEVWFLERGTLYYWNIH